MEVVRSESWRDPRLKQCLQEYWNICNPTDSSSRTNAIKYCFVQALSNPTLNEFRPDAIWTAIQKLFIEERINPALKQFINDIQLIDPSDVDTLLGSFNTIVEVINSARQGWVRSSGVALENACVEIYDSIFSLSSPEIYIVTKSNLRTHPIGKFAKNIDVDGIGTAREDDLYLIVVDKQNSMTLFNGTPYVFGVIQVKSSVGDRTDQAGPRSRELKEKGYLSLGFTLDPMEVARSMQGMMIHPSYMELVHGSSNKEPIWHYLYIVRNDNLHRASGSSMVSRIKNIDIRSQPDPFVLDVRRASIDWLNNDHKIPAAWN